MMDRITLAKQKDTRDEVHLKKIGLRLGIEFEDNFQITWRKRYYWELGNVYYHAL